MRRRNTNRTAVRLLVVGIAAAVTGAAQEVGTQAPPAPELRTAPLLAGGRSGVYTRPKVVGFRRPAYPRQGRAAGRDALVHHRICISADGRPDSFELLPIGFHTPDFVREAERFVRSLVFEPATLDGKPVPGCVGMPLVFSVRSSGTEMRKGVTADFRREFDKAAQLIAAGDLAGAHHHTEYMLRDKVKLLYEYAVLHASLADTYARAGNAHRAIEATRNATIRRNGAFSKITPGDPLPPNDISEYLLPKEWLVELLTMRVGLAASNGLLAEALQAHYELASLAGAEPDAKLAAQAQVLEKALAAREPLSGNIVVGETGKWDHPLLRAGFTVSDINGKVNSLDLQCGPNVRDLAFEEDLEWKVPDAWQECVLTINAEPDTALTVIEFPSESSAPTGG